MVPNSGKSGGQSIEEGVCHVCLDWEGYQVQIMMQLYGAWCAVLVAQQMGGCHQV